MNKSQKKYFLVVDDHVLIRLSLEYIIQELFLEAVIFQANSLEEAGTILDSQTINYVIIDISFPEGSSLSFVSNLIKEKPGIKVLVYSAHEDDFYALSFLRAGACGFLSKLSNEDQVKAALNNMVIKGKHISADLQEKIMDAFLQKQNLLPIEELSTREMEVAKLLVEGQGNLEIAAILNTKQSTISTIKSRIFQKLEITNLPELIEIFKFYKD
ncbi:response regulator transcription factor [Flavobacterium sp. NRK F10]|uniref:response regulator transcription factor n=1 Tax=Flavobacterium sp. NRK F10 TaxID=2954931 RepID=UPI002091C91B|nr:response regulator transcription factor [Flavobacterium sp. NRK F10]MCO6175408.1 response regulator transcription factor [Flavobacterium sp. NRK F10]